MFSTAKRLNRRMTAVATGVVSLAVVATSTVALASSGSAAAPRAAAPAAVAAAAAPISTDEVEYTSRVAGTVADGRQVTGTFRPAVSKVEAGVLMVRGRVRATIFNTNGTQTSFTKYDVWMPVKTINGNTLDGAVNRSGRTAARAPGDCQVLNLVLGPLDLNVLGLVIELDRVVLDIFARPGPGNLLGNLLCAVAGLLDGTQLGGLLAQVSALLNSILAILSA